jgi:hypothetical protein
MRPKKLSKRYLKRYLERPLKRSMRAIALRAWPSSHEVNAQPRVGPEDLSLAGRRDIVAQREAEAGDATVARLQRPPATSPQQWDFHQHECDVYRGDECVLRGGSLRQAAELLNIDMFELAVTILKYERCMVGEFSVVPSADVQDPSDHRSHPLKLAIDPERTAVDLPRFGGRVSAWDHGI